MAPPPKKMVDQKQIYKQANNKSRINFPLIQGLFCFYLKKQRIICALDEHSFPDKWPRILDHFNYNKITHFLKDIRFFRKKQLFNNAEKLLAKKKNVSSTSIIDN